MGAIKEALIFMKISLIGHFCSIVSIFVNIFVLSELCLREDVIEDRGRT